MIGHADCGARLGSVLVEGNSPIMSDINFVPIKANPTKEKTRNDFKFSHKPCEQLV